MAEWLLSSRSADGRLSGNLPIKTLSAVVRHIGVGTGVATVPWSAATYGQLIEGAGVVVRRNGRVVCSGFLAEIEESWPEDTIKLSWVSEQVLLQDRLVIPDPTQTADWATNPLDPEFPWGTGRDTHWVYTGLHSTVMTRLIEQQVGPSAYSAWQVPGLSVGPDPLLGGAPYTAQIRYGSPNLLAELQTISAASYGDLGVRVDPVDGGYLAQVVGPVDSQGTARFSADLRNLTSYSFTRKAPTATSVIVTGKPLEDPDNMTLTEEQAEAFRLANTPAVVSTSTDPITLAWGRTSWTYKDQSSISDPALLAQAGQDVLANEAATVSLTCTLADTERLKFGEHWDLGHRVTVDVGRPGEPKKTVSDVVREVAFEKSKGGEKITPAIGSPDATALPSLPSRQALNNIKARLAGLERKN